MNGLSVLLTVDWEANHGLWQHLPSEEDYGGVLVGTGVLMSILDEFNLACTWLVECHADIHDRDLTRLFPEKIVQLGARPRDEVGAHIHWVRREAGKDHYPIQETAWIDRQVTHARDALSALGMMPRAFRSGGFLRVPSLPAVLEARGYSVDASHIEALLPRRFLSSPVQPYRCDRDNLARPGASNIIEFPTHFRIAGRIVPWFVNRTVIHHAQRLSRCDGDAFLTLYLHIDELTIPGSGRNEQTDVDESSVRRLRTLLTRLMDIDRVTFITMSDARRLYV